jgi:hypothetical protein
MIGSILPSRHQDRKNHCITFLPVAQSRGACVFLKQIVVWVPHSGEIGITGPHCCNDLSLPHVDDLYVLLAQTKSCETARHHKITS